MYTETADETSCQPSAVAKRVRLGEPRGRSFTVSDSDEGSQSPPRSARLHRLSDRGNWSITRVSTRIDTTCLALRVRALARTATPIRNHKRRDGSAPGTPPSSAHGA